MKIKIDDVRGIHCPRCGTMFSKAARCNPDGAAAQPGHRGMCVKCDAFILLVRDGLLVKAVQEKEEDLPENIRAQLPAIKENNRRLREFHKMQQAFEGLL